MTDRGRGEIERRKAEHFDLTVGGAGDERPDAGWEDVHLVHRAVPEIDVAGIDLRATFLGRTFQAPLMISGMTGGHARAMDANRTLAAVAARFDIPMGVGSQRAALRDPSLEPTYRVSREIAPEAFLMANLGAAQLVEQDGEPAMGVAEARGAVRMIDADALVVHLNFTEEVVQPEGDRRARGVLAALAGLVDALPVPVLAKETGAGISRPVAMALAEAGVAAIDVGGRGGTSFAAVEQRRAAMRGDRTRERLGELLHDWGIPTPVSIVEAGAAGVPVIGSGGVRSGLDAAKALALGADMVGVARPLLQAALKGEEATEAWVLDFLEQLRVAMFLTGVGSIEGLSEVGIVTTGGTWEWLGQLGGEEGVATGRTKRKERRA